MCDPKNQINDYIKRKLEGSGCQDSPKVLSDVTEASQRLKPTTQMTIGGPRGGVEGVRRVPARRSEEAKRFQPPNLKF